MAIRNAFVWTQQYTLEQLQKLKRIRVMRRRLDPPVLDLGRFALCQLQDTDKRYNTSHSFDGVWEGKPAYFEPRLRPLFMDYAVAVYAQVLQEAHQRYPGFTDYLIEEGPLVGERRIHFPGRQAVAASQWMHSRFYGLARSGKVKVPESFQACWKRDGVTVGGREKVIVDIVVDRPCTDISTWEEVRQIVSTGKSFPVETQLRSCRAEWAAEMLVEVSLPELYPLNWECIRKPMTEKELALFAALGRYEIEQVRALLAAGADPNVMNGRDNTPLQEAINFWWADRRPWVSDEKYRIDCDTLGPSDSEKIRMVDCLLAAGAHPDWAAPNECTALTEASLNATAAVVTRLLDVGADPSIQCYDDEQPYSVGSAWSHADYRRDRMIDNKDDSIWDALESKYINPWTGIREDIESSLPETVAESATEESSAELKDIPRPSVRRPLLVTDREKIWLSETASALKGEVLLRYARAFNLLDVTWLEGAIADSATYDSQSVMDTMVGAQRILEYFRCKIEAIRANPDTVVRMELGMHPQLGDCVLAYQMEVASASNLSVKPVALMDVRIDAVGMVTSFTMCTVVPPAAEASRSYVVPGMQGAYPGSPKIDICPER